MSNMHFELNYEGVGALLKSDEIIGVLKSYADGVAKNAGEGYSVYIGPTRANVSVQTDTDEAIQDNLDNNTLLKAVRR